MASPRVTVGSLWAHDADLVPDEAHSVSEPVENRAMPADRTANALHACYVDACAL
jgi:hypothetical protein